MLEPLAPFEIVKEYKKNENLQNINEMLANSGPFQNHIGNYIWKDSNLNEIVATSLTQGFPYVNHMIGATKWNNNQYLLLMKVSEGESLDVRRDLLTDEKILAQIIFASKTMYEAGCVHLNFSTENICVKKVDKINIQGNCYYNRYFIPDNEYLIEIQGNGTPIQDHCPLFDFFRYVAINSDKGTKSLMDTIACEIDFEIIPDNYISDPILRRQEIADDMCSHEYEYIP